MPTKEELLNLLKSKTIQVRELEKYTDGDLNYQFYRYYWLENDVVKSAACCIVETPSGDAYFKDAVPSILKTRTESFSDELSRSLESAGFSWYRIDESNEPRKFAIVTVFLEDASGVVSKKFLVWKDKDGNWNRRELVA